MAGLRNPHDKSKGNGAAPPSRRHDPAPVETRFSSLVKRVHELGPRPTGELLLEMIGKDAGLQADALLLLERYAALDPAMVRALDGDDFTPPPIHAVADR